MGCCVRVVWRRWLYLARSERQGWKRTRAIRKPAAAESEYREPGRETPALAMPLREAVDRVVGGCVRRAREGAKGRLEIGRAGG